MLGWIELPSVVTSVASGVLVALLVEGVIALRTHHRRRSTISGLRAFFLDFKKQLGDVRGAEDGRFPREAAQFAIWKAHLEDARVVVSSHAPDLRREHFVEVMEVIGGHQRIANMIPANQFPGEDANVYSQYFERLGTLRWLNLDA